MHVVTINAKDVGHEKGPRLLKCQKYNMGDRVGNQRLTQRISAITCKTCMHGRDQIWTANNTLLQPDEKVNDRLELEV